MLEILVNGTPIKPEQFELHRQSDPFPGGSRYTIKTNETGLVKAVCERYTPSLPKQVSKDDVSRIFNLMRLFISMNFGRSASLLFWGNTIDQLTFDGQTLEINGICSPHLPAATDGSKG